MVIETEPKFHVLAVDDSLVDRKLIEKLLKTSSYQVTAVDSGSKALEFLGLLDEDDQRNKNSDLIEVNLIITDYSMPGMTGYDLLRKIKESDAFKDIPVVIMSSENIPSRIDRCLEEGAEDFFLKPVQLSDVKKLKPHLLEGRSKEINSESNNITEKRKGMELEDQEINSTERTRTGNDDIDKKENDVLHIFMESLKIISTCCSNQMVFPKKEEKSVCQISRQSKTDAEVFGIRDLILSSLTLIILLLSSRKIQIKELGE